MFRFRKLVSLLLAFMTLLAGCTPAAPVRATWEYIELTKDEKDQAKEVGDKHTLHSGGNEMYEIKGRRLEVLTVTSAKARFRLTGRDAKERKEFELESGESQDLWLGAFGVRVRVEKIGPIP